MTTTSLGRKAIRTAALAAGLAIAPLLALAQDFPQRPLTLVVPYPAGGATDTLARILSKSMAAKLGQPVIVENKAGAGTTIGAAAVANAAPDGYTMLISSNTTFTINPALKSQLPYDPLKSFESIGILGTSPLVLLAHPSVKANTVQELVALAKAQPGKLSFGSFGAGTTAHFAGEMFKAMASVDILHVPYKGSAPAMQDLIGGQIPLSFDTNVAAMSQIKAGKVKAIGLTSAKPTSLIPGVPTIAAVYPGYEMVPWITVVTPRGLPEPVRTRLTRAFADSISDAETRATLQNAGVDVQLEAPARYEQRITEELPKLRAYVHKAGLEVQ